jgi:hypothetical protein
MGFEYPVFMIDLLHMEAEEPAHGKHSKLKY